MGYKVGIYNSGSCYRCSKIIGWEIDDGTIIPIGDGNRNQRPEIPVPVVPDFVPPAWIIDMWRRQEENDDERRRRPTVEDRDYPVFPPREKSELIGTTERRVWRYQL